MMDNLEDIITQKLALAESNFHAMFRQFDIELTKALVQINTYRDLSQMPLVQLGPGGQLIEVMPPPESMPTEETPEEQPQLKAIK